MTTFEPELTTRIEPGERTDEPVPSASFEAGIVEPEVTVGGVESRVLLARARHALLGWDRDPVTVGRYRILERIGSGGMGVVYSAHDDELDRQVAIKILRQDLAQGAAGRTRLLREAQATARLSHPNVIHVYEVGQESGQVFMAMELVRGDTLRMWLAAERRSWLDTVQMFLQAGEGLAAAHAEGLVHRDFKPDNVLVGHDGRPRVLDFGLARVTSETLHGSDTTGRSPTISSSGISAASSGSGSAFADVDLTRTGTILGTPAYMAPEQLDHGEPSARSDQFSFCVALFEGLYARRPFVGATYEELAKNIAAGAMVSVDLRRAGIPRPIHDAITRGLAREPGSRHHDMRELLAALREGCKAKPPGRGMSWAIAGVLTIAGGAVGAAVLRAPEVAPAQIVEEAPAEIAAAPSETDAWAEIVASSELPDPVPTPLPGDPTGVTIHRLANGLTVYIAARPREPQVTASFFVRSGPREQGEFGVGLGSLTFDAVLNGGDRLGAVEPELEAPSLVLSHRLIEALEPIDDVRLRDTLLQAVAGAEMASAPHVAGTEYFGALYHLGGHNPSTRFGDAASLTVAMPPHRLDAWVELTAELLRHPNFRMFTSAASHELSMYEAMPSGQRAPNELLRAMASATGLHDDMAAAAARTARVPLGDVRRFHEQFYRPNNVALVLVGDVNPAQMIPVVEKHFADWKPAKLPTQPEIDTPLPVARKLIEVQEASSPLVMLGWPLPPARSPEYAGFAALGRVLSGPEGLLTRVLRDRTIGGAAGIGPGRHFFAAGVPLPGMPLPDAEKAIMEVIESVAADRVAEDAWGPALAYADLERQRWARNSDALTELIGASFSARQQWADVVRSIGPNPVTREEVVAAAGRLLARGRVAVHRLPGGRPWKIAVPTLPSTRSADEAAGPSEFVKRIVDAPATPVEPRFLVDGSHYRVERYGAGRFISTAVDEPLARMSWIYAVGVAAEPWACDAAHAKVERVPLAGFEARVYCTVDETRIDVVATTPAFTARRDELIDWLVNRWPDEASLAEYGKRALAMRNDLRDDPDTRAASLHVFAIRGDAMLDGHLPPDGAYERAAPKLAAAFSSLVRADPDVLYVGPDPAAVLAALPKPRGIADDAPRIPRTRTLDETIVFVLDDPEREEVSARVALPWIASTPREQLAGMFHISHARMATWGDPAVSEWENPDYVARWSSDPAYAIGVGLRTSPVHVAAALHKAVSGLRARPPLETFPSELTRLEVSFRGWRVPPNRVPDLVRNWTDTGAGGSVTDPRVAQWLALPSLSHADLEAYWQRVDETPLVISIAANADELDREALAKLGKVVDVGIADVVRDPWQSEVGELYQAIFSE